LSDPGQGLRLGPCLWMWPVARWIIIIIIIIIIITYILPQDLEVFYSWKLSQKNHRSAILMINVF